MLLTHWKPVDQMPVSLLPAPPLWPQNRSFAFLCFTHLSTQKSTHQAFVECILCAKISNGYSRGDQRWRIHAQCFQELGICGGDTCKDNTINIDTEEIFIEVALTFLFSFFKVISFFKNRPPASDAFFSSINSRKAKLILKERVWGRPGQGKTLGSGWRPPIPRFSTAEDICWG